MVQAIETVEEFEEKVTKDTSGKLIVVDFWASWCRPCVKVAPVFERLSTEHADAVFYKVDIDVASEVAKSVDIQCMPTFKFYKNGTLVETLEGASGEKLKELVAKLK